MKKYFLIFGLILFQSSIFSQVEYYTLSIGTKVKYYQDFLSFLAEDGKTKLDVFIKVPYPSVQFIKTGQGFEAGYSVTVSIYNEDEDRLITEKIWNEKIVSISFEQTVQESNFNLSHRSFELNPGAYRINTLLTDKDSRAEFSSENILKIKDFSQRPVLSDLMLVEKRTVVEGSNKIIPNVSRDIITEDEGIPLFFELYQDSSSEYKMEYTVSDLEGNEVFNSSEKRKFNKGSNQILYTIDSISLNIGKFIIKAEVKNSDDEVLSSAAKSFMSRWEGVPSTITDLDKAVDQLIYIANPDEISYMEDAKDRNEKTKRFVEFWKKRDKNPSDEYNAIFNEYFSRVAFADENFTSYSLEGWRSDRGMVLIILGIPDNIDRHPFEYYSKPYEVWQYYDLNRSFIFIDNSGFGDYRLSPDTPLYGDLYRFRY
ncbi:MAG: GWxTD domain-containing protein [Ignavibacteria bacterium]|nr:GWxTD domain-containing protein [Ignavibacteria bacterium]MBT8381520.1 GWxTD domain-containing protein [Ignavibacteria bacterium]MBT8391352.1 GWxTD domain-containing protein [Ignavibacteria bacterium]NNJ53022.1 GWxTD domain-containing protein [Ignavibacteriaceae bacterium]NNL21463.1 GWxTD domain-containing protein [Ignavibacteriaceae bacterium]